MNISRYYGLSLVEQAKDRVEAAIASYHNRLVEAGALSELKAIIRSRREA